MENNPYAAPGTPDALPRPEVDLTTAKRLVRGPATALIVLAIAGMLLDALVVTNAILNDAPHMLNEYGLDEATRLMIAMNVGCNGLLFILHLLVLVGAYRMLTLRNYSTAITSAVVSLFPFCSPLVLLGIPFGIWALVVLCRADVRTGFRLNEA